MKPNFKHDNREALVQKSLLTTINGVGEELTNMGYTQTITFGEAKAMAKERASNILGKYKKEKNMPFLEEKFQEAECCWIFFRNREIKGKIEESLDWNRAYAISKRGTRLTIADFFDEPEKLGEYLQRLSDHLKEKNA